MKNMAKFSILLISLILIIPVQAFADSSALEQRFSFRIKAANVDSVFQGIIKAAEERGGYFTNFSDNSLSLRIPAKTLQEFGAAIASFAEIEDKSFSSADKSAELERLGSQIESRKKLLETYLGLVKNAPFAELQAVEREMAILNAEIERLQGQKSAMEKRAALALITIYAYRPGSPDFRPARASYESPFDWINSTNLNSLRRDF